MLFTFGTLLFLNYCLVINLKLSLIVMEVALKQIRYLYLLYLNRFKWLAVQIAMQNLYTSINFSWIAEIQEDFLNCPRYPSHFLWNQINHFVSKRKRDWNRVLISFLGKDLTVVIGQLWFYFCKIQWDVLKFERILHPHVRAEQAGKFYKVVILRVEWNSTPSFVRN